MSDYYFEDNTFIVENYNHVKPFSSFLPGIAGKMGIPMWLFYVNRGQCIASFGIKDKNGSIMEFFPANKAYQLTPLQGFRTFIKIKDKNQSKLYEPFSSFMAKQNKNEKMHINSNELKIEDTSEDAGLHSEVTYFTMPNENFAALVRKVKISNISNQVLDMELLDGAPAILPYGLNSSTYKEMSCTMRAWMNVSNLENNIAFYNLRGSTEDTAEINLISGGHFYLSYTVKDNTVSIIKPIVDADLVFGQNNSFMYPSEFMFDSIENMQTKNQVVSNKVPCGFSPVSVKLSPGESTEIVTIIGNVSSVDLINSYADKIISQAFIEAKHDEAVQLVETLTSAVYTKTSSSLFDGYAKQNYLDNLLRGGVPLILDGEDKSFVYHVYSRKHGDLERDYNFFSINPSFYSQGNGNFRDANQNRRCDVLFNPEVKDFNVIMFMNFIQADGYNPLVVKGCSFNADQEKLDYVFKYVSESDKQGLAKFFAKPYTPGDLLKYIEDNSISLTIDNEEFLSKVLAISSQDFEADFGEGYWIDHWTYNMDLVDAYLAVYPDQKKDFLFNKKVYRYYDSPAIIVPRKDKYVLVNGKVRQLGSVEESEEKQQLINERKDKKTWVRNQNGKGEIYETNLFSKLVSLALNKFTTMDALGMGIEMEANKPGWNDSTNGLPGTFASGVSETCELKRLVRFILDSCTSADTLIYLPVEMHEYLMNVENELDKYNSGAGKQRDFLYWDAVYSLRETYRDKVKFGFDGEEKKILVSEVYNIFSKFLIKIDAGIEKAMEFGKGIMPTYINYEVTDYEFILDENGNQKVNKNNLPNVKVKGLRPIQVPYFLEGPTRSFKVMSSKEEACELYKKVKCSNLYDKKLKMYKVCESLESQSYDIGRARSFTPGWLENESIFLHMEYKYLLGLLNSGLYEEFFEDMKNAMVPFLDPAVYGRNILENSSFIASSANPDESTHGTGFIARLSGSTAEFLSMWNIMLAGKKPFRAMSNNELCLVLEPTIPGWFFDENGIVEFKFLGSTIVRYINPQKLSTFGEQGVKVNKIELKPCGEDNITIEGSVIFEPYASLVRNGKVEVITLYLE